MHYRTAAQDTTVTFDLEAEGDLVVPDGGSVSYKVRKNNGTTLATGTLTGITDTRVSVPVLAANNAQTLTLELRDVSISWVTAGKAYAASYVYRLVPWLMIPVAASDVRNYFGLTEQELRDDEVDLIQAYYVAETAIGDSMATILAAGDADAIAASSLILYIACLSIIDSLELRALSKEQGDNVVMQRFSKVDFAGIRDRLVSGRAFFLAEILPAGVIDYAISVTLRPDTDPVTGA